MKRGTQAAALLLWALLLAFGLPGRAAAQGVTTSALAGRVTNEQGQPVAGAQVVATNTRTGTAYRVVTRADGRFSLQGLQPGGPYRVAVSGLGYAAQNRADLTLSLGQTAQADFILATEALALEALSVTAEAGGSVISSARTGASTVISDSSITRLPTISRDFTDFTRLVPQVSTSGGGSFGGGRNNRFNNIQIDGAVNNDLFGLAASGTPGGQAGTKAITLEAIQEFQVVLAPFDVRQGGFTGIGINAITKSGTNDLDGTVTFFGRNQDLVGNFRTGGNAAESADFGDFKQYESAFSVGGPIMRDKVFFFAAGELSRRDAPNGVFIGAPGITINPARADSVVSILSGQYGYDAGSLDEINLKRESNNLFGRLDFNLNDNHRLTLRHNFVDAWDDNFSRSDAAYQTSLAGYRFNSKTNASVAQLNSTLAGSFFNELRVGYTTVRDNRGVPTSPFSRIEVDLPAGSCAGSNCRVVAGPENFSIANQLDQDILEITNDLSFARGIHNITVGTHNEFFQFSNLFARNLYGLYRFAGLDSLRTGRASRYEYSFFNESTPGAKRSAEFPVRSYSVYAQDRVGISSNFNLTVGARVDWTSFPETPGFNTRFTQVFDSVYQARGLGRFTRRTDGIPDSKLAFNPRVGFNWDVTGDKTTQFRGGVGIFSGRTPYVWISNAFGNTGLDYTRFTCSAAGTAPRFNPDPLNQPRGCRDPVTGNITSPALVPNEVNLVDPDFELPRVLKYALGLDRQLPYGLIATFDALYTKSVNDPVYRDLTVGARAARDSTVEGRAVWTRVTAPGFGNVYDVFNTDENYSYSLTAQLQKPFENGWEFMVAYTYGRSFDVNALRSSQAASNFRFNPIDDNPNNPERRPSDYDVPHRIVGSFTRQFQLLSRAPTDVSLIYVGESGRPYSYTYTGDINNDGSDANDLIYVPANAGEARFASGTGLTPGQSWLNLDAFIQSVECLREARGEVLQRNACRQPWSNRVDLRVAQSIPTVRTQGLQLTLDILNFANLLNPEWGSNRFVLNQNEALLARSGSTDTGGHVLLSAFAPKTNIFQFSDLNSRYQIQLGVRYSF